MLEREMKLGAGPGFHLPDLDGIGEGLRAQTLQPVRMDTHYFDTPDLRLVRWGFSLRHRRGEGWTLKMPSTKVEGAEGALSREEITFVGPAKAPPKAAVDLVRAYVRRAPLAQIARLSTLRHKIKLFDSRGQLAAEVVDDEVTVLDGRRVAGRFRELEVELGPVGDVELLTTLANRLRAHGAGAPDPTSKLVRALGPPALEGPEVTPGQVGPNPSIGEAVRLALAGSVHLLLVHDPLVRTGGHPEYVHQARVATRRLRSDLRLFGSLLDPVWVGHLRDELSWIAGELGKVRDSEVLLERLQNHSPALAVRDRSALGRLTARIAAEGERGRVDLVAAMSSPRYLDLLDGLVEAARTPRFEPDADAPAGQVLPRLALRAWRPLRKAAKALGPGSPDQDFHAVRILAKRARYSAEACAPVVGRPARELAKAAAALQTVLGEHQDAVTAQAWIRTAGTTSRQGFVAGQLYAIEAAAARRSRAQVPAAWKALNRPALREWMAAP